MGSVRCSAVGRSKKANSLLKLALAGSKAAKGDGDRDPLDGSDSAQMRQENMFVVQVERTISRVLRNAVAVMQGVTPAHHLWGVRPPRARRAGKRDSTDDGDSG